MLKQILATSALLAIIAASAQPAAAASKLRQLVVEPSGASADADVLKKKKKFPSLVAQPGSGIATPVETADAGKGNGNGGKKNAQFLVRPSQGIQTPVETADAGSGNGGAKFIIAPSQGLPTPGDGNGNGAGLKGKGQRISPAFAKLPDAGIATPVKFADAGADPIPQGATKSFPLIASAPEGLTTPADVSAEGQATADDAKTAPVIASVAPAATATTAVASPGDLYSVLTGHGYGVQILQRDGHGNLVFYVTAPASPKVADLLLVDGTYGKVIERKHIAAYGYEHAAPYSPPHYASAYGAEDNCDQSAGY